MNNLIRNILLFCLSVNLMFSACQEKQEASYAVLSGKLSNFEGKGVGVISSPYAPIGNKSQDIHKKLTIDESGSFTDTVRLEKGEEFTFYADRAYLDIMLKPGNELHITADCNDLLSTIKYTGLEAPVCNFRLKYNQLFKEHNDNFSTNLKLDEQEFIKAKETFKNSIYQLLESSDGLTDEFIESQKKDLHYGMVSSFLNYDERHGKAVGDEDFKTSPNFLDIVSTVNMEDSKEFARSFHYGLLLQKYYSIEYAKVDNFWEEDKVKYIQFLAQKITDKKIKEELLFLIGKSILVSTKEVQLCYDILVENIFDEDYRAELLERYNKLKSTMAGQPSPLFVNYQNVNGGTNSLSDFLGKYVYIDIWATWCGPCIAEIPFLKEVEKKYHNKNIVFISLSVDDQRSFDKWKTFVKNKELGGVQLIADKARRSDFIDKYQIEGIPRFILIDPKGKIVSSDAPRPSDKKLIELFNKLGI